MLKHDTIETLRDCDALLILDEGSVVASGTPGALRSEIGKELIIMKSRDPVRLLESVRKKYDLPVYRVDDAVRVECDNASAMIGELLGTYEGTVDIVTFSRPSVGDVYIKKTGHQFRSKNDTAS